MAISIDGVVYSVSANTNSFEKAMNKIDALQKKQAALTDKYNNQKIKATIAIEDAEKKLAQSRAQFASLQNASSKEEIEERKQIERQIQSQERALTRLKDKQTIAEADYQRALKKTQEEIDKINSKIGKYGKLLNTVSKGVKKFTLPLTAIAGTSLYAWGQQEEALQRMESALKSNGLDVSQYSKKFQELASNIQKFTTTGDEAILKNQQLALSMGVSAENMDWVQRGAVGLEAAFGMALPEATKKLAGALQGNFEPFNELIPEMRNASSESEKLAILNKRLAEYWGIARDKTNTFNGALQQTINDLGDASESIGKVMEPAIVALLKSVQTLIQWFNSLSDTSKTFIVIIGSMSAALPILAKAIIAVRTAWIAYTAAMSKATTATNTFKTALVKTGIGAAIVAIGYAIAFVAMDAFDKWIDKSKEFEDSTESAKDEVFEFNTEIQNSKTRLEETTKAIKDQENALVAYHKALDELNNIKAERAFRDMTEQEQLEELTLQYDNAASRLRLLEGDLKNNNMTLEHRAFVQEQIVKWTKELFSIEDKMKDVQKKITDNLNEQNKALAEKAKKEQDAIKKQSDKNKKEQEAADRERERIANSQKDYELNLKIRLLEAQGNTELANKFKLEKRIAELMSQQGYSREKAYRFAKLEQELDDSRGKKVKYSDEDIEKAKKIVERGEGGSVGKKTMAQAKAILAGEAIDEKEVSIFEGASKRAKTTGFSKIRIDDTNNLPNASTQISDKGNKNIEQGQEGSVVNKLDEILNAISKDIPKTLTDIFSE